MAKSSLRLPLHGLSAGERTLDDSSAKYLVRVHRCQQGDDFIAFDPQTAQECSGHILSVARSQVRVELKAPRASTHLPAAPLVLLQGLPKATRLDTVVRAATELGVTHLLIVACERSQSRALTPAQHSRVSRISVDAARQCGRGDLPKLKAFASVADALKSVAADLPQLQKFLLHPTAAHGGFGAASSAQGVLLAVGPEGGFNEAEVAEFEGAQLTRLRVGQFTLRTETAAIAALGAALAATATCRTAP